jgi:hypothetical protein
MAGLQSRESGVSASRISAPAQPPQQLSIPSAEFEQLDRTASAVTNYKLLRRRSHNPPPYLRV